MPTFASRPDLEFEYALANELGMTVARLRAEMPAEEFVRWQVWHGRKQQAEELASRGGKGR